MRALASNSRSHLRELTALASGPAALRGLPIHGLAVAVASPVSVSSASLRCIHIGVPTAPVAARCSGLRLGVAAAPSRSYTATSLLQSSKPAEEAPAAPEKEKPAAEATEATGADADASAADGEAAPKQPAKKPGRLHNLTEGLKDVFAVVFGVERKRDLGAEYDAGLRKYPWFEFQDPHDEKVYYKNEDTGVVTEHKPADFDLRAPASARMVATNMEASALTVVAERQTPWQRTVSALGSTPVIAAMLHVGEAVAASPVGQAAKSVKTKVADKVEDAREVWETSQHPLIVNAAYAVDSLMAETESGRALREIQLLDSGFDQFSFVEEMTRKFIPTVVAAFFKLDMPVLRHYCKDSALAQMRAVAAAREIEGLSMDGTILNVQKVELVQAKALERGLPILLVSSQVQYIHCIRNKKGEITEGSESEIRAAFFVFAVTREVEPDSGNLIWRAVEMSMQGSMLYL